MTKNLRHILFGLVVLSFFLISCDDDQGSNGSGQLSLQFSGITRPGDGFVYGVWLKENGSYNLLGDFTINSQGNVTNSLYSLDRTRLNAAEGLLITLENETAIGSTPGPVRFMAGTFLNKGAVLAVESAEAVNATFTSATGSYILSTPTDATVGDTSGVWYYDTMTMQNTLELPDLGENWLYESWVTIDDTTTLSLGKFANSELSTMAENVYGSALQGYPAQGQDFITNNPILPANLIGKRLFMSVEPVPDDNLETAFGIRPFSNVIMRSEDGKPVPLDLADVGVPRGLAIRQ